MNDILTPEQYEALKVLAERPDLVRLLMEFGENMSAARRVSKWVAYIAGIATAIAGFIYYIAGIMHGRTQ